MKTICLVSCYHDTSYVRATSLLAALQSLPNVKVIVVKNRHRGLLRYPEVIWKLWRTRRQPIDAYLLAFRGQEILPLLLLLAGKKPVIFDEYIIPLAYAQENHARSLKTAFLHQFVRLIQPSYRHWLKRCRLILADTEAHASLSAQLNKLPLSKYLAVPVGTDEALFYPKATAPSKEFQVFYYSTGMQPLHGVPTVLEAAVILKDRPDISFLIVGGKQRLHKAVIEAQSGGANITYRSWIPFEQLADYMRQSGLCLGGPFGGTTQAQNVVTTKTYQMLATAVPALIGDSPVSRNYFKDRQNVLMVPQANPQALADRILWASKHRKLLHQLAIDGRKLYESKLSVEAIAQRLEPAIGQLLTSDVDN